MFLDGFQFYCGIQNRPIQNLVKLKSLVCGDLSRDNFHYIIQDSVVIIAHGRDTWLEQGGGTRGGVSMKKTCKRA